MSACKSLVILSINVDQSQNIQRGQRLRTNVCQRVCFNWIILFDIFSVYLNSFALELSNVEF